MTAKGKKKTIWNLVDGFAGDKVVLIITLLLILTSIVCIFSSSSRLVTATQDRTDIALDQLKVVGFGLIAIFLCYQIRWIGIWRALSACGFAVSFAFLLILDVGGIGPIKAPEVNGAVRFLQVGSTQIHVYEIVKVAMVMYIAWAVDALQKDRLRLLKRLAAKSDHLKWLDNRWTKKTLLLYIPFVIVFLMVAKGSNSAAILIAAVMLLTSAIGTGEWKELIVIGGAAVVLAASCFLVYSVTKDNPSSIGRIGTAISRLTPHDYVKDYHEAETYSERIEALDKLRQPYSARIAIKQGGIIGKGPGQSTQRYVVPDMSEDYMFSFILEEYGWFGGVAVIILYLSLVARGVLIVRNCKGNLFAQCAVMGLVMLISSQAMLHIINNGSSNMLTGQTLPLISRGASAFVCFCIAFGAILAISRISNRKIEKQTEAAAPLIDLGDPVQNSLSDLESFENDENEYDTI